MFEKKKKILIIATLLIITLIGGIIYFYTQASDADFLNFEDEKNETIDTSDWTNTTKEETIKEEKKILIHITGEVNNPGVVSLKEGARIIDAINEAGGTTEKADLGKVNLAYILEDAQKVYIPSINEADNKDYVSESSGQITVATNSANDLIAKANEKIMVNINTANEVELQRIPGIGETIAGRIVAYRKQNGKYKTIEDIQNVSGVGTSKFQKIKQYICVK